MRTSRWLKFLLTLPKIREIQMDEEVLFPAIERLGKTPEQVMAAKRLYEWMNKG